MIYAYFLKDDGQTIAVKKVRKLKMLDDSNFILFPDVRLVFLFISVK